MGASQVVGQLLTLYQPMNIPAVIIKCIPIIYIGFIFALGFWCFRWSEHILFMQYNMSPRYVRHVLKQDKRHQRHNKMKHR